MTIDQAIELLKSEPVVAFDADRYWNANDDEEARMMRKDGCMTMLDWNLELAHHGIVRAVELESRCETFVCADDVSAVRELNSGGSPARLIFSAGGHIDVCGCAGEWSTMVRIARLRSIKQRLNTIERGQEEEVSSSYMWAVGAMLMVFACYVIIDHDVYKALVAIVF